MHWLAASQTNFLSLSFIQGRQVLLPPPLPLLALATELGGEGKRLPAAQPLDRRQEDFLFHPDVAKEPGAKLIVGSLLDKTGMGRCLLQQPIEPPVVFCKKSHEGSCDSVLSLAHPPVPIQRWKIYGMLRKQPIDQFRQIRFSLKQRQPR